MLNPSLNHHIVTHSAPLYGPSMITKMDVSSVSEHLQDWQHSCLPTAIFFHLPPPPRLPVTTKIIKFYSRDPF